MLEEGWYLMDVAALERELRRFRTGEGPAGENVEPLTIEQALAYRNAGNVPDELGRTLRLVLHVGDRDALESLDAKRLHYEPDHLDAPTWRREGSKPVNVVPFRSPEVRGAPRAWWEDERMAEFEREWAQTGMVAGVTVPGEWRSFVYKTVAALTDAGRPVTVDSIVGAIERWVTPDQAAEIRLSLERANS